MFTFLLDTSDVARGMAPTAFMAFFAYVWTLWTAKALAARRYRPSRAAVERRRASVIVPVYRESPGLFDRSLRSVRAEGPAELIAVVDGGDARLATIAAASCDQVLRVPKAGKRAAIAAGLRVSDPTCEVVVVLDSDTIWTPGTLHELLRPFADPRVGGVTPRQGIFAVGDHSVRRLADWLEDIRYTLTVPAQSVFGQVGCLAGRTIAYRRTAFEPAVARMVSQTVLGVEQHVGDDRVLTNELLRNGWRTVYQSTARVLTDAPPNWSAFWRQQLRWGRSSQRETLLSARWLWRRPVAATCFVSDMVTPFALYAVVALAVARAVEGGTVTGGLALEAEVPLAYAGMVVSIGVRQLPHLRHRPGDVWRLPLFVLQLTLFMVPVRIFAFATMLHQGWGTRSQAGGGKHETALAHAAHG